MSSWCTPENPTKKMAGGGDLIGEIYFQAKSADLDESAKSAVDALAKVLATHPKGIEPTKLRLLGDTDAADSPKPDWDLAKRRAQAVEAYLNSKLPEKSVVKIDAAGKGAPFPPPPPGAVRRAVVEIINKGKPIKAARDDKAKTKDEALRNAQKAADALSGCRYFTQKNRILHWIKERAKVGVMNGNDSFLSHLNTRVQQQAVLARALDKNSIAWKELAESNRIMEELMIQAGDAAPLEQVQNALLAIDGRIEQGLDYLAKKTKGTDVGSEAAGGLRQMIEYIEARRSDPDDLYWIYFQAQGPLTPILTECALEALPGR